MFNNILNNNYRFILTFILYLTKTNFSILNIMFNNVLKNYRITIFSNYYTIQNIYCL